MLIITRLNRAYQLGFNRDNHIQYLHTNISNLVELCSFKSTFSIKTQKFIDKTVEMI